MIEVDQVTKYYGARPAVRDLTFRIEDGECVGFLGLNGAGKSTTLKMLSCLLLPTAGRVRIRGYDVEESPHEIRKILGFLPDSPPVYGEMTVRGFVRYAGQLRQMEAGALDRRLPEVLGLCGLEEVADEAIGVLSHGYRQRVGIAQAIIHDPSLLILDEPIQGLDPVQIVEMREMIRGLRGRHTILMSTHILSEIEQTCDRILMLHQGRLAAQGTEDELLERLGGAGMVDVTVAGDDAAGLGKVLGQVDGVSTQEVAAAADDDGTPVVRARVAAGGGLRSRVSRAVVEAGYDLLALEPVETGLEQIFVRLSREDAVGAGEDTGSAGLGAGGQGPARSSASVADAG